MVANTTTAAITIRRDTDVYRLAAIVLSTLDRAGVIEQQIDRIVVYSRRVVVFDILRLSYAQALDLINQHGLLHRLTRLSGAARILIRPNVPGCAFIFDLGASEKSRESQDLSLSCVYNCPTFVG